MQYSNVVILNLKGQYNILAFEVENYLYNKDKISRPEYRPILTKDYISG